MDFREKAEELGIKDINFNNNTRLNKRFVKVFEKCSTSFGQSFLSIAGNRKEAKATYRMFANENFKHEEIVAAQKRSTISAIEKNGENVILVAHDTASINYSNHEQTEGLGLCYGGSKTKGVSVHSSLAMTEDGVPLGLLHQATTTRLPNEERDNLTEIQKGAIRRKTPIEEKESYRWIDSILKSSENIPEDIKLIHICDREGDMFELFDRVTKNNLRFLIRIEKNRLDIDNNVNIMETVRKSEVKGTIQVSIPRNSRENLPGRETTLSIRFEKVNIKKPRDLDENKSSKSTQATVIYVKEETPPSNKKGELISPIEWTLLINETINDSEEAFKYVQYYVHRWKIERLHFILKSGCKIEKIELRTVDKLAIAILMYSIISVKVLNITYLSRMNPDKPCDCTLYEDEWKLLYCMANKTKEAPDKPYTIREAIDYLGTLGSYKRAPSDGLPGVESVWKGFIKLQTVLEFHFLF